MDIFFTAYPILGILPTYFDSEKLGCMHSFWEFLQNVYNDNLATTWHMLLKWQMYFLTDYNTVKGEQTKNLQIKFRFPNFSAILSVLYRVITYTSE